MQKHKLSTLDIQPTTMYCVNNVLAQHNARNTHHFRWYLQTSPKHMLHTTATAIVIILLMHGNPNAAATSWLGPMCSQVPMAAESTKSAAWTQM